MQRAAELQAGEREIGEGLTEDEVVALGRDVGIPGRYLQQAILEERTHLESRPGQTLVGSLVGPVDLTAQRVVRGEVEDVERTLVDWMQKHELLTVQRQLSGRITWEPLTGMQAAFRRGSAAFDSRGAKFMLAKANLVGASVNPLEPGYCHVGLSASLRGVRGAVVGGAATLVGAGLVSSGILVAMNALVLGVIAPVPIAMVAAWAALRSYRPTVERVQLGLERALDHLERGVVKPAHQIPSKQPGVLEQIAGEIRKAIRDPQRNSRSGR